MTLADLFPETDYRFQMRFERDSPAAFFQPTDRHQELMAQREHWLNTAASTHAAVLPEAAALVEETFAFAYAEKTIRNHPPSESRSLSPIELLLTLGRQWEPDFLLLQPDSSGSMRLMAGCVCFPSSWSLEEKMGHPIEIIHGVVPGLNPEIGKQIHSFLSRLKPGTAWLRANWGLSRSPELNQHPHRNLPRLDAQVEIDDIWLRIEHQSLLALPGERGVLFGIRIAIHPLREIQTDRALARRVVHALRTMPEEMAQYKNIASSRQRIVDLLQPPLH